MLSKRMRPLYAYPCALGFGLACAGLVHVVQVPPDFQPLIQERNQLQEYISLYDEPAPLAPVYKQWEKLMRYTHLYKNVSLAPAKDHQPDPSIPPHHDRWHGVLTGPSQDLLLLVRSLQTMAPVHLQSLSIQGGQAHLSLSVIGRKS